jgi:competence protein ComEA
MPRNLITGYLALFAICAAAFIWHGIDFSPKHTQSPPASTTHDLSFPEQKFLAAGPININEATIAELEAIPRIGPVMAERIYEFRRSRGRLNSLDELLEVRGIGPRILEAIHPYMRIDH